jgi:hypothetical protein
MHVPAIDDRALLGVDREQGAGKFGRDKDASGRWIEIDSVRTMVPAKVHYAHPDFLFDIDDGDSVFAFGFFGMTITPLSVVNR